MHISEIFPKKQFKKNGSCKSYTSYLNFTKSKLEFTDEDKKLKFECIFCDAEYTCELGRTNNILTHLRNTCKNKNWSQAENLKKWLIAFEESTKEPHNKIKLSLELLKMIKFFISSNMAASCFDDPFFRDMFSGYKMKIPCSRTFSESILPDVFDKVKNLSSL